MIHPRPQTPQGESFVKPETPLLIILSIACKYEVRFDIHYTSFDIHYTILAVTSIKYFFQNVEAQREVRCGMSPIS